MAPVSIRFESMVLFITLWEVFFLLSVSDPVLHKFTCLTPADFSTWEEGWHTLIPLANTNLADNVNLHARRRVHIDSDNDDNEENAARRGWGTVSQSQYYAFQLQNRDGIFSLLHTGRLCPACLKRSSFWHHIQCLPLTSNIRLFSAQMTPEE